MFIEDVSAYYISKQRSTFHTFVDLSIFRYMLYIIVYIYCFVLYPNNANLPLSFVCAHLGDLIYNTQCRAGVKKYVV